MLLRFFLLFSILILMKQKSITLPSFAKINLSLRILGKRTDGFHELFTIFQTISLKDTLDFYASDKLSIESDDENIPVDERNLVIKAGKLLQREFKIQTGAKIYLKKRIPFPAGLGGGSSNAAVALLGLATLWDLDISTKQLYDLAKEIGSDVPFFLYGGTAVGTGRGTELLQIGKYEEKCLIIVTPKIDISTKEAYANLNAEDLTNIDSKSILKICREEAKRLDSGHLNFRNDFEESVFKIEPKIKQIKEKLLELEAKVALLSGSGASVFAIFDNEEQQQVALSAFESNENMRKFAVNTISREDYAKALSPCGSILPKSF